MKRNFFLIAINIFFLIFSSKSFAIGLCFQLSTNVLDQPKTMTNPTTGEAISSHDLCQIYGGDWVDDPNSAVSTHLAPGSLPVDTSSPSAIAACSQQPTGIFDAKDVPLQGGGTANYHCVNGKPVSATSGSKDADTPDISDTACGQAASSVNTYCTAAGYSPAAGQIAGVVSQVSSAQASGDYKSMCESAAKLNQLMGVANAGVSALCLHAISTCDDSCSSSSAGFSQNSAAYKAAQAKCDSMQVKGVSAATQAVQNYAGYAQSEICVKTLSGKCIGQNAYNDPDCQQYCMLPGRQSDPKCSVVVASCGNPTYASQNATTCACVNNPTGTGCPGANSNVAAAPNLNGLDGSGLYGNDPKNNPTSQANNGPALANTGFSGSGGGGSAPIGGAPGGEAKNTNDAGKDILLGTSGSAGGYNAGGGGVGYADGGSGKGGAGGGGAAGLDLRAFLPGGKNDPKRGIASIGGIDPSITSANGLSNFQKVTRKMNEKRVELMP